MSGLPSQYANFIHLSRYARWGEDAGRRETWAETVTRYMEFFKHFLRKNHDYEVSQDLYEELMTSIYNLDILPSMRCLMTAGPALTRDHVAGYNCAYLQIDDVRAFDEMLFILMCGTGVGFSVERQVVNKLPKIPEVIVASTTQVIVRDSKLGWAEAYRELIAMLYAGRRPQWDVSQVRPKGARLVKMGGRASGPDPLVELFEFTVRIFEGAQGRKLTSLECHDIACKIGECVVVGGVRRSAMLSLSNLSDQRMRDAKSGQWWESAPHRRLANNSIAYTERPEVGQFMTEWMSLYESKSGERGMFNRNAAHTQAMSSGRRRGYWDDAEELPIEFGTNPCSEILLRSNQFCNLTENVIRPDDDEATIARKVELATILGTWQSCLTNFRYLRKRWGYNCKEERLLGVSMTGIMDNSLTSTNDQSTGIFLDRMRKLAVTTNAKWSLKLGVAASTAITCVKPSGTASQLAGCGSGIHSWHAPHYIRRVRQDTKDPLTRMMIDAGFPHEPDVTQPDSTTVFSFPIKAPDGAVCRDDRTAIEELEHWKMFQDHWCEHKPSVTITVREHEWPAVGAWVWENFDSMSGVSFLPHSEHSYRQAPYEEITVPEYDLLVAQMPVDTDWTKLGNYERDDEFLAPSQELACTAGACEI